jgi:hypothetical protein
MFDPPPLVFVCQDMKNQIPSRNNRVTTIIARCGGGRSQQQQQQQTMKEIRKVTWSRRDHVTFILVLDK